MKLSLRKPINRWLDRFGEYEASLPFYRVLLGFWLLVTKVPTGSWLKEAPAALLFPPPGTPLLVGSTPPSWAVDMATLFIAVFASLLMCGVLTRWAALGLFGLLLTVNTWMYAFGKIDHDILILLGLLILAFSNWGRTFRLGPTDLDTSASGNRAWVTGIFALAIGLAMFTAALPKLFSGWLDPTRSAARFRFLENHYVTGRSGPATELFLNWDPALFWIAADLGTVLLEGAILFFVITPRLFRLACAAAAIFHLGIWALMDIDFHANVIAYAAFVRWDLVLSPLRRLTVPPPLKMTNKRALLVSVLSGMAFGMLVIVIGSPPHGIQSVIFGRPVLEPALLFIGGTAGLVYITFWIYSTIGRRSRAAFLRTGSERSSRLR